MANTVIALKKSSTPSATPTSLANGELAINYADGKLFYRAANGTIVEFASGTNSFGTINANGTFVVADTTSDVLSLLAGENVTIVGDAINDTVTIGLADAIYAQQLSAAGDITADGRLISAQSSGDEGGEIVLATAQTNNNLSTSVTLDIYQNKLRIFETGGTNRGVYIDLSTADTGVGTDLLASSGGVDSTARATAVAAFGTANLGYDKANSANLLAYNTGIGANAFTSDTIAGANAAVGAGANSFASATIAGANTAVGAGANAYAATVGTSANAFTSATIAGANTAVGAGANAYADIVGTSANAFASATIAGANVISVAAFGTANSAYDKANSANIIAVAAFDAANNAVTDFSPAYNAANAAFDKANSANLLAYNTGIGANAFTSATIAGANTAVGAGANAYADIVGSSANAFASATIAGANTAVGTGANAYAATVGTSANAYSDSTFVKLTASSQTITGNLNVVGNFTLSGNTIFLDATRLQIDDPLIYLAGNNYISDTVDIGFIANYVNTTGANVHTGLYREHVDKMYYLFQGYDQEPMNNHIGALSNNMTLAVLNADLRTSNLELAGKNTVVWITSAYDKANTANITADLAFNKANAANVLAFNALPNTSDVSFAGSLFFPTGNVGIRTLSSAAPLSIGVDNTTEPTSGDGRILQLENSNTSTSSKSSIVFYGSDAGGTLRHGASMLWGKSGPWTNGGNDYASYLAFYTRTTGSTQLERIRIDANGNVGIGTTNPILKLDVQGSLTQGIRVYTSNTSGSDIAYFTAQHGSGSSLQLRAGTGYTYLLSTGAVPLYMGTNSIIRMTVDASGNVGIGTTSVPAQLTIVGAGQAVVSNFNTANTLAGTILVGSSGTAAQDGGAIVFSAASTAWRFAAIKGHVLDGTSNTVGDITFQTRRVSTDPTLTETLRVSYTGNVLIGRTDSTVGQNVKLDVNGAVNASAILVNGLPIAGGGAAIPILTDTVSAARYIIFSPSTTGNLTNANVSTTLVYNPATGNVGIGTANPTSNLHVIGTANISSTIKSAGLLDSSNRLLLIKSNTGAVVWGN